MPRQEISNFYINNFTNNNEEVKGEKKSGQTKLLLANTQEPRRN